MKMSTEDMYLSQMGIGAMGKGPGGRGVSVVCCLTGRVASAGRPAGGRGAGKSCSGGEGFLRGDSVCKAQASTEPRTWFPGGVQSDLFGHESRSMNGRRGGRRVGHSEC